MGKNKIKIKSESILQTKEGFTITVQQALAKIRSLRSWKARDSEFFELNGLWHDLLQLYQFVQEEKKWNGERTEIGILSEAQNKLLNCKIEKIVPETYPCGVLIKALEATRQDIPSQKILYCHLKTQNPIKTSVRKEKENA